jgi:hypothetical protein
MIFELHEMQTTGLRTVMQRILVAAFANLEDG